MAKNLHRKKKRPSAQRTRIQKRLRSLLPLLHAPKSQRKTFLRQKRVISCLCEIAKNVLNNNIKLSKPAYKRFKKYRVQLRTLTHPRQPYKTKTKVLQKGGFLNILLPLASTLLGGLLGR